MKKSTQDIGVIAEKEACDYLIQNGLKLITKNYRTKLGEIDLIMKDGNSLIFIEVRYRKECLRGQSEETIDFRKQKKLIRCAMAYLQCNRLSEKVNCRFDVVAINNYLNKKDILWIKDAFQVE